MPAPNPAIEPVMELILKLVDEYMPSATNLSTPTVLPVVSIPNAKHELVIMTKDKITNIDLFILYFHLLINGNSTMNAVKVKFDNPRRSVLKLLLL